MEKKREKSIFGLLPPNLNFAWFLAPFALNNAFSNVFQIFCINYL